MMRRFRFNRKPVEERMTPREAAMAHRLTTRIEESTELKRQLYEQGELIRGYARALKEATGASVPSPNYRRPVARQGEVGAVTEHRPITGGGVIPADTHAFNGTAEQRPVPPPPPPPPPRRAREGGVIRNMEALDRLERMLDESPDLGFDIDNRRTNWRIFGMIACMFSLAISVMLYLHPIIMTWLLNWKIE